MKIRAGLQSLRVLMIATLVLALTLVDVAGAMANPHHHHDEDDNLLGRTFILDRAEERVLYSDLPTPYLAGEFTVPGISGFIVGPAGRYVVANSQTTNRTSIYSSGLIVEPHGDHLHVHGHTARLQRSFVGGARPAHLNVTPDGRILVANDGDDTVTVVDPQTG